jgi:hypothetical protein
MISCYLQTLCKTGREEGRKKGRGRGGEGREGKGREGKGREGKGRERRKENRKKVTNTVKAYILGQEFCLKLSVSYHLSFMFGSSALHELDQMWV